MPPKSHKHVKKKKVEYSLLLAKIKEQRNNQAKEYVELTRSPSTTLLSDGGDKGGQPDGLSHHAENGAG